MAIFGGSSSEIYQWILLVLELFTKKKIYIHWTLKHYTHVFFKLRTVFKIQFVYKKYTTLIKGALTSKSSKFSTCLRVNLFSGFMSSIILSVVKNQSMLLAIYFARKELKILGRNINLIEQKICRMWNKFTYQTFLAC